MESTRVFIVDDSEFILGLLSEQLTKIGYTVIDRASNGTNALEKYKALKDQVDIVTLDVSMPEMDGIQTLKELLKINPGAKVIMISSLGYKEKVREAIVAGAKHFIVKPFTPAVLKEVISYVQAT